MIVTHSATPATTCSTASHQPTTTSHTMLPSSDMTPAPGAWTTSRPNGQSA